MKQSFDWKLVLIYLLLVLIGWLNIYAAGHSSEPGSIISWSTRSGKQFIWMLTAFGLAGLIVFVFPPRLWEGFSLAFYLAALVLLVAVVFLGVDAKGSKSWFEFGPVRFQPAEVSKISTSLTLALVMSRPNYRITRLKDFLLAATLIGVPMLAILFENETGSALVYVGFIFVLYREGLSGWFLSVIGIAILIFILTLTASPFTAILTLIGLILLANCADRGSWRFTLLSLLYVCAMALLPAGLRLLSEILVPGASLLGEADPSVKMSIMRAAIFPFILKIKPIHILIGSAVLAIPIFLVHAYKEKNRFLLISVLGFLAGVVMTFSAEFLFNDVLQDHQRKRIEVLLGMKEDPSGVGYNVAQSMIAIGSGGLTGKGYLEGTQTTFGFVPEQCTDFIFCTVGEEWGFAGCLVVILLYVILIWRIVQNAERSRESFTRIYGYCTASCLFMHLFINIGMTIGLMPVIGIPLPLMSYGGSSLWAFTVMIFIFIVLDHEEKKYF